MSWLAALDRSSRRWPFARWSFVIVKWSLAALGAFLCVGLAVMEFREHRVGLGTGLCATVLLGTIKGILTAFPRP